MNNNAIKFIITGCSGFIGNSIANNLVNSGYEVIGLTFDNYISNNYEVKKIDFKVKEITNCVNSICTDIIIHAAGSSSVGESLINPWKDFDDSVNLLLTLLEGIRLSKCRPLVVYPSSASVYGNPVKLPVKENDELCPISPYGYHKLICEKIAEEYSKIFSIPIFIVRLFSVFGPNQKRLLIWDLFQKFMNDDLVILDGTGKETRDYIYIDDLTNVLIKILSSLDNNFNIFNIASGFSISIEELALKIKNILKSDKNIIFKGKVRIGDPLKWQADISNMSNRLNEAMDLKIDRNLKTCIDTWIKEL